MSNNKKTEKEILAERAVFRANSGFHFIQECLKYIHVGGTDGAYSRSLYILFSYNFELLLKSRVLLASTLTERKDLVEEVKTHNLELLKDKLSQKNLNDIGIKDIKKETGGFARYRIELVDGNNIILEDFTDVRYDFSKDELRPIDRDESNRMYSEANVFLGVTKKIMNMLSA